MGLVDDLLAESGKRNTKRSIVAKWLDDMESDVRDEWLAVLRHPDIAGSVAHDAMCKHGFTGSQSTVTMFRRLHLPDYTAPD